MPRRTRRNPLHVYGETKLAAEIIVLENAYNLVLRTSLNAGNSLSGKRAFNEQLRHTLHSAGQGMKLFMDEFRCPVPAAETARTVWELVGKKCAGLYHVAGGGRWTRRWIFPRCRRFCPRRCQVWANGWRLIFRKLFEQSRNEGAKKTWFLGSFVVYSLL
jgi:hypothetical protein